MLKKKYYIFDVLASTSSGYNHHSSNDIVRVSRAILKSTKVSQEEKDSIKAAFISAVRFVDSSWDLPPQATAIINEAIENLGLEVILRPCQEGRQGEEDRVVFEIRR
ncbi:hypothetical protein M8818_007308 [Zalaria obscura]|uniref:Uncharacterized protein n=1 Tax=Zalaria obscura TaxID=2024903 RepID=A0ACC3S4N7_9PEZI